MHEGQCIHGWFYLIILISPELTAQYLGTGDRLLHAGCLDFRMLTLLRVLLPVNVPLNLHSASHALWLSQSHGLRMFHKLTCPNLVDQTPTAQRGYFQFSSKNLLLWKKHRIIHCVQILLRDSRIRLQDYFCFPTACLGFSDFMTMLIMVFLFVFLYLIP